MAINQTDKAMILIHESDEKNSGKPYQAGHHEHR